MSWVWTLLGLLVLGVGLYRRRSIAAERGRDTPVVDDAAIRQIVEEGRLHGTERDGELDLAEAAEAEEEFWSEYWDEPDEY